MKNLFTFTFTLTLTFTLTASAETVKTATQPWVRAYVATNHTDVTGKADATSVYTKAETDAKIVELAPSPGDYATVSNRAMSALQSHQSLDPATNYTDAALGAFARTNKVLKGGPYVAKTSTTPSGQILGGGFMINGWLSSTGSVSVVRGGPTLLENRNRQAWMNSASFGLGWATGGWTFDMYGFHRQFQEFPMGPWTDGPAISFPEDAYETGGVLALRSDIPDVSGHMTSADVTAAIREQSLGGIWDAQLEVWWTPVMVNGALTYQATTNVNLNAEGN